MSRPAGGFRIGSSRIDGRVLLAPLSGITDSVFRRICRARGAAGTFSEMLSADGLVRRNRKTLFQIRLSGAEQPVGGQLFGSDAGTMLEAARMLEAAGFDFIDINAGCPARKIVKRGAGCALADQPALLARIVEKLSSSLRVGVTVKFRAFADPDSTVRLAGLIEQSGAAAITIHGRPAAQFHGGEVLAETIGLVKSRSRIPVIANGGVVSPQGALGFLERTGSDAVMIGRGCLGRPWLFEHTNVFFSTGSLLPEPPFEERIEACLEHFSEALRQEDEHFAVPKMRKHIGWYLRGMPGSAALRARLFSLADPEEIVATLLGYRERLATSARSQDGPEEAVGSS